MRKLSVAAAAIIALALAAPALAHVTVQPKEAPAGSFSRFVVRVPNERDDAATTKVEMQFPPTLTSVKFQPNEGWQRQVTMKPLDEPLEVHGRQITEVVDTVTWEGGRIPPGEFDEFGFSARLPQESTAVEFPALQTYDSGEVVRWIGEPGSDEPAAQVSVIPLPTEEGQGQLALLADVSDRAGTVGTYAFIALALGAAALAAALGAVTLALRRRY